jgi:hypothetical protein
VKNKVFYWLFTLKMDPGPSMHKNGGRKHKKANEIYQNYIYQFRYKGNVLAEPLKDPVEHSSITSALHVLLWRRIWRVRFFSGAVGIICKRLVVQERQALCMCFIVAFTVGPTASTNLEVIRVSCSADRSIEHRRERTDHFDMVSLSSSMQFRNCN